ncbi:MAG: hypothetical protein ABW069_01330 [Duganella sp.]
MNCQKGGCLCGAVRYLLLSETKVPQYATAVIVKSRAAAYFLSI